jgi:hypothetical protein
LEEQKGKQVSPDSSSVRQDSKLPNPTEDWLKSAIDHIHTEKKDDLDIQPTIDKLESQTTISRDQYQTSALPTDRILKREDRKEIRSSQPNNFQFLYSLSGLLLGTALSLTGLLFLLHGYFSIRSGDRTWISSLIGIHPASTNDLIPGLAVLILGAFVIFITREKTPPT